MQSENLREFLEAKVEEYNQLIFIENDPITVPHQFSNKQDIEIAAFFASVFAWGSRKTIIAKTRELMNLMDRAPHQFILQHEKKDLEKLYSFKHRTFNTTDLLYFIERLGIHYHQYPSLENAFLQGMRKGDRSTENALNGFHDYFFSLPDTPHRTKKHISCPRNHSACKRLSMFLRWMVRKDEKGVDFGIWKKISPAQLICPIDLHVAKVATRLGLLTGSRVDWQAATNLTEQFRNWDAGDPVKYDFALFGLGIMERFY